MLVTSEKLRKIILNHYKPNDVRPFVGRLCKSPAGTYFFSDGHTAVYGPGLKEIFADLVPFEDGPNFDLIIPKGPGTKTSELTRLPTFRVKNDSVIGVFSSRLIAIGLKSKEYIGDIEGKDVIGFNARYVNFFLDCEVTEVTWNDNQSAAIALEQGPFALSFLISPVRL